MLVDTNAKSVKWSYLFGKCSQLINSISYQIGLPSYNKTMCNIMELATLCLKKRVNFETV